MTKSSYFDMCEMLGSAPIEEEVPVEFDDLPLEVQEAVGVYNLLKDEWDFMNGNYLGKSLTSVKDILDIYNIDKESRIFVLEVVFTLDSLRKEEYAKAKPKA